MDDENAFASAFELDFEKELGVADRTFVSTLKIIKQEIPKLIPNGGVGTALVKNVTDEVVDNENGVGDVSSSHA
jgi:anti-sigma regulatory factor (Ser/Thr protein kinase)